MNSKVDPDLVKKYPPGSNIAVENGCLCPIIDNNFGKGYDNNGMYIFNLQCPLHGRKD
jgi:hypothetical protein